MASQQGNAKMTWNHEADMALIRAVLEVIPVGSYQIRDIALKMEELGYTCSVKAVSYAKCQQLLHLHKLFMTFGC